MKNASASEPRKCVVRACSCALRRLVKWNFFRLTIKCWAARAGRAISAVFFQLILLTPIAITHDAAKVGDLLRDAGVIGRFAIDFVVTRAHDTASWETYAIEINLRKGGTTHPFLTLQFLTGGSYDPENATFIAPNGHKKFLVASDHLESPRYQGYTPDDLFDLVVRRGLHFGQVRQTGVVFHMLSALGSAGRLGLTAVGNSPEEAQSIFDEAKRVLDEEARFNEL